MHSAVVFWIIAALVVVVTLGVLLRALLGRYPADDVAPADDSASVAIFRDQKRQLDEDLANGVIDAGEHARMRDELAARLGREISHPNASPSDGPPTAFVDHATVSSADHSAAPSSDRATAPSDRATGPSIDRRAALAPPPRARNASSRARWIVAGTLIVLLPVATAALYFTLGRPGAIDAAQVAAAQRSLTQAQVLALVEKLAQRMKANPEDPKGWALLGRSYAAMGRFQDAADAFAEATQRAPNDAVLLSDYADTLSMAQGSLQGKPTELTAQALAIDPHNQKALALAAASTSERHAYDEALRHWRTLAADLPVDSDAAREVAGVIADTLRQRDAAASGDPTTASAAAGGTRSASPAGAPPVASTPPAAATGARISGNVALSVALAARAQPGETVFIYARAVNGPRMPLAVLRTTVRELPRDFVLDDSMAMAPGAGISSAQSVVVEARVSKTGNAMPASGDLIGTSPPTAPGSANIHVLIDRVVP
jgi:cytochrome c-type biogenesis protein CcmH